MWASVEVDRYLSSFKPEVFKTAVIYSERFQKEENRKYQLKQYWIQRLEKGIEIKARIEKEQFDPTLAQQMLQHLTSVIEKQPLRILEDRQAIRNIMNIECLNVLRLFSQQPHSSRTVIPENLQVTISTSDDDPMEISFEPRKRKAEEELEERPEKYRQINEEEEEIRQTQQELMALDEENQNQLIEIDQLRQLQTTTMTPDIIEQIINRIAKLKLKVYNEEQYIRERLNAWFERQKILIPFRKYKKTVEQLNVK